MPLVEVKGSNTPAIFERGGDTTATSTVATGSDFVVIAFGIKCATSVPDGEIGLNICRWDGTACTLQERSEIHDTGANKFRSEIWTLQNPSIGTKTITIDLNSSANFFYSIITVSLANVFKTGSGVDATETEKISGSTTTLEITTINPHTFILDQILWRGDGVAPTQDSEQALIATNLDMTEQWGSAVSYKQVVSSSEHSMSWSELESTHMQNALAIRSTKERRWFNSSQ